MGASFRTVPPADTRILNQVTADVVAPSFLAVGLLYLAVALSGPWLERNEPFADEHRLHHGLAAVAFLACWLLQSRPLSPPCFVQRSASQEC